MNLVLPPCAAIGLEGVVPEEERLLIMLWHLAERWGEPSAEGIRLSIRIPHRLLAEMVGARHPSITSALAQLQEAVASPAARTAAGF